MKLDCDVICDLLPSYVDNLTSEKSNVIIREHLSYCPECQKILSGMKEEVEGTANENKEIDYLKAYRRRAKRSVAVSSAVWILLTVCLCFELVIHLFPLYGAKNNNVTDYLTYPLTEVSLSSLKNSVETSDGAIEYRYEWDEGNFLQKTVVSFVADTAGEAVSPARVNVDADSAFFEQAGSSVNVIGDTVYVYISGYRKTLFVKGRAEHFCFAIKISNR